ncbi:TetR/AcrR family transcriptional regulator [Sphingopyxis sp. GW247-27LB]|uniref:TetR/AcrR family transcriptional regulator n=1 Tax=Sphingopyxis sp. GW247-27LB TaxID=2012632 RepID=UPI000BA74A57|nr:TetR/AcrR family transcriptional regulator [Sphingopyxis sp. GW247-27LB]PAL21479.1 TetR family transcriptional regulator [Sphingopyxis sp. GW247-27LB]
MSKNETRKLRTHGVTRQAIKSATTRARIIDATVRCLVKYGYARTTTLKVAEEADVSRGAMMHHFENAAALIYATAEELHQRRLKSHVRRAKEFDHQQTSKIVHQSWDQFTSPNFTAFLELAMAARTDQNLASILLPLQREYSERWYRQAIELYPEWEDATEEFDLAFSLSQITLQGMALALVTESMSQKMIEPVLRNLEKQILNLRATSAARRADPPASPNIEPATVAVSRKSSRDKT